MVVRFFKRSAGTALSALALSSLALAPATANAQILKKTVPRPIRLLW